MQSAFLTPVVVFASPQHLNGPELLVLCKHHYRRDCLKFVALQHVMTATSVTLESGDQLCDAARQAASRAAVGTKYADQTSCYRENASWLEGSMQIHDGVKAMVLAAGVGSRLEPLTLQLPKPLVPFANKPVMEHITTLLKRHGITQMVSNVHYLPEKVPAYFGDGSQLGIKIDFVNEPALSGDAGGLRACREYLEGNTLLVVMGDLITDMDLTYVLTQHREKGSLATIALKQVRDVERFGVAVLDSDGRITGFQEKPSRESARSNYASTGVYVFEPEIFDHIPPDGVVGFGKDVFPLLIERGLPVLGVEVWGYWSDVGTLSQYKSSTVDALHGLIDLEIPGTPFDYGWIGDDSTITSNCHLDGVVLIGNGSHIGNNVTMNGFVVVGDNCIVEDGTHLSNSIIWGDTIIGAGSRIDGSIVAANCYIPNLSRIMGQATVEPANPFGPERMQMRIRDAREFLFGMAPLLVIEADELELDADLY